MKNNLACAVGMLLILPALIAQYRTALPGYKYQFPRDYFNHPDFQTEWWYYTGNVRSVDGHRFGFELTFFRVAVNRDPAKAAPWDLRDLYMAHLALSDLDGGQFYHAERMNRAGPGLAGASEIQGRVWNGNWKVDWQGSDQQLQALDDRFQLNLALRPEKPVVIHGEDGVSQKAAGAGRASHYISFTRLATSGSIDLNGKSFSVTGLAWMDHEFFTQYLDADQIGWNWMGLQLEDHTELMMFSMRRKDGSIDPYSAGTFVDTHGASMHLRAADFALQPLGDNWTSPVTHAVYPTRWKISVPKLGLELVSNTSVPSQEVTSSVKLSPNYWEGAVSIQGHREGRPIGGVGYLEMTGYDHAFELEKQ